MNVRLDRDLPPGGRLRSAGLWLAALTATIGGAARELAPAQEVSESYTFLFARGDINADGRRDIADPVLTLFAMFGPESLPCQKAADFNDDGALDIADPIGLLRNLFLSAPGPSAPAGQCGVDPSPDALTCEDFPPCEYETLVASYSTLSTVAGRGFIREKDRNGWEPGFEGGAATEAELSRPHMTMGDAAGNLYIADKDADAIRRVSPDGIITTIAGTGVPGDGPDDPGPGTGRALDGPNGLWVRSDGTAYILDTGNGKVRRLDPDGTLSTLFADPAGIPIGRGLWVSDDESLVYYAAMSEVRRWRAETGIIDVVTSGFAELGNLVVAPDGALAITDRGASRVYRWAEGEAVPIAGNGGSFGGGDGAPAIETGISGVRGIWFHPLGGYFLATHEGSQVWYVDRSGIIHLFLAGRNDHSHTGDGEHFQTPGAKISEPRAIVLDYSGNVVITENDYGFVRMIQRR